MARIRTLKPEFWADEKLAPLPPLDRLVFLGLISLADDAGRVLDNVRVIDAQLFPETPDSSLEPLRRLSGIGRIRRGITSSGQRIVEICNWKRHQKISHPNLKAAFPEIVEVVEDSAIPEPFRNQTGAIPEPLRSHSGTIPTTYDQYLRPATNNQRPVRVGLTADVFETAWKSYPKRPNNSKAKAWRAWSARVKEGTDPAAMLEGVMAYAGYVTRASLEPRFVKQAATFFGPDKPFLDDYGSGQDTVHLTDANGRPTAAAVAALGLRPPADA